ncbi:hypothetical protein EB822_05850 [Flavobacteriaceae bacterium PRS1]|nr:hypothetical protein EB822_05850 [Flavobacteriaceae bacterium PRS1]
MLTRKLLLIFIILLAIVFIGLQVFELQAVVDYVRPIILPLLALLYYLAKKEKSSNFFYFLLFYSIGEISSLFSYYAQYSNFMNDLLYYGGNILFITAYVFLILEILKPMNIKKIFNRFTTYILILAALDIYSIILVTDIAIKSELLSGFFDYLTEIVYNTVIMLLLTITLINYISSHTKKAMNLLLGALCIVFSEVIQVAYYYVSDQNILSIAYSVLLVLAFTFFYIQTNLSYAESEVYEAMEELED